MFAGHSGVSERQDLPLTAFAPDLEDPATGLEVIVSVWRRLFGPVDPKTGCDGIRGRSTNQPCRERHSALEFNLVAASVSANNARKQISLIRALFHRALTITLRWRDAGALW